MDAFSAKALELRMLAEQLEMIQRQKRQGALRLKHLIETSKEYTLLLSVPGVGKKLCPC